MGLSNYVVPLVIVLVLILIEVWCDDVSNTRTNDPWSATARRKLPDVGFENYGLLTNSEWSPHQKSYQFVTPKASTTRNSQASSSSQNNNAAKPISSTSHNVQTSSSTNSGNSQVTSASSSSSPSRPTSSTSSNIQISPLRPTSSTSTSGNSQISSVTSNTSPTRSSSPSGKPVSITSNNAQSSSVGHSSGSTSTSGINAQNALLGAIASAKEISHSQGFNNRPSRPTSGTSASSSTSSPDSTNRPGVTSVSSSGSGNRSGPTSSTSVSSPGSGNRPTYAQVSSSSGRFPTHNAPMQTPTRTGNNKPMTPQSWPRPPPNPQSILRPVSISGNGPNNRLTNSVTSGNKVGNNEQQTTERSLVEDNELREFSEALLSKDVNSALKYIRVNYQGKTTSRSLTDEAPLPLIEVTNRTFEIPTIERLKPLYDNYIVEVLENEHVTPLEREEENRLLDAVISTPVMRFTRNFLIEKGVIGKDPKEFRDFLKLIWFTMYSRGKGKIGSSAFEHVFLTEIKDGQVSGLHNWVYFNFEEAKGNANYLGYMNKLEFGNKGSILKFHFKYRNIDKPVGSMFVGTSPEFEMALYTTCFALRADKICPLQLDGKRFIIRTFSYRYRGKNMIGSAFPEI